MIKELSKKQAVNVSGGDVGCICTHDRTFYFNSAWSNKGNTIATTTDEQACYIFCCQYQEHRMYSTYELQAGIEQVDFRAVTLHFENCTPTKKAVIVPRVSFNF